MENQGTNAEVRERLDRIERMLQTLVAQREARPRFSESAFLSKAAVARRLGCRKEEVARLIREGHLPTVSNGKRDSIPATSVQRVVEFIANNGGLPPPLVQGVKPMKPRRRTTTGARSPSEEARAMRAIKIPTDDP